MSERADLYTADLGEITWKTSTYTAGNGNCVEVGIIPASLGVAVRDTKDRGIPATLTSRDAWAAFVTAVANHELRPE
ncbi:DUF397 domain-containing protein [Streptomyces radicis]|uniref:DUF397 domain-containing protein n=1 Tax=Streptomyces radicis TaxID=1750517 RepID=A0A3A9W7A8_9ACTN|nr:DUF397 domain-containing protein [Streptomyces radicis]RKN09091.1 DUF397 domain-containing protein [Streptomyces radicis]RKN22718.1 DUF397 domain-containing protein [Streptomyces radicis]